METVLQIARSNVSANLDLPILSAIEQQGVAAFVHMECDDAADSNRRIMEAERFVERAIDRAGRVNESGCAGRQRVPSAGFEPVGALEWPPAAK